MLSYNRALAIKEYVWFAFLIVQTVQFLPPVHSKLMSHYQLSKFAIHGLEHSETDMNS